VILHFVSFLSFQTLFRGGPLFIFLCLIFSVWL